MAAACALIVLLTIALVVNFRNTRELHNNAMWVAHTRAVLDTLEEVNSHLREAEALQRTFVLMGDETILPAFEQNIKEAQDAARRVQESTADTPDQRGRLPDVIERIDELAAWWRGTISVRQAQGLEVATQRIRTGNEQEQMADVQQLLLQADVAGRELLGQRSIEAERTYSLAQAASVLAGIASLAGVLAFLLLMQRRLKERDAAARTVAEFGERLRTTLASIGDAVISTDNAGCITNMNPVAEALTGWSRQEAFGHPLDTVFKIVNENTREPVPNPATRALKQGVIVELANHTSLITKDGTERSIEDSAAPIRCKAGETVGAVLVFRDVTERRKLERELQQQLASARLLASIVESSDDAIISKSLNGTIQSWNAAAEKIFGYPAEEAIGRPITMVIPEERITEEVEIIAALRKGERIDHFDTERVRKDGRRIRVSLTISPLFDDAGEVVGASKIARDVTREREAEERERQLLQEAATANFKFRAYFDQGAVLAGLMDLDGTLVEANRLSVEGCGFSRDDVVGRPFAEGPWWSKSPELVERVREACRTAAAGEIYHSELPYYVADGSERVADVIIVPVKDDAGNVLYLAPIGTDITERKQVEADCQKFITVVENSTDFIGMCDLDGRPFYVNPAGLEMVGLNDVDEAKETHVLDFFFPEDRPKIRDDFFPSVLATGHGETEVRFRNFRTGEHRWIAYKVFPLTDDEHARVGMATVSQDVTERRIMEDSLRALATDLSEADRRKDEFLAMLAHELRNPLAPIRNGLQILRLSDDRDAADHAHEVMERQLEQLVRLVDDLLDVSRITRGKLELRKSAVRLSDVIRSAVETIRPIVDEKGHSLNVEFPDEDILIDADLTRLAQVFVNLLNNSAKYTDRGGRIELTVQQHGNEVLVAVTDNGIGIAADHVPQLFDMFSQADHSLERSQGGLGIGLTLVKRLTEMHGGQVGASSTGIGHGATFTVRLPVLAESRTAAAPHQDGASAQSTPPLRILVVDDNQDSAHTLSMLLEVLGHETRTAYDGEAGVAAAAEFRPHVVLLDIGLPRLNGYETCRRIREQDWGQNVRLFAVTGWGQEADRRRSEEAGFDDHLVKPVAAADITRLLAELPGAPGEAPG